MRVAAERRIECEPSRLGLDAAAADPDPARSSGLEDGAEDPHPPDLLLQGSGDDREEVLAGERDPPWRFKADRGEAGERAAYPGAGREQGEVEAEGVGAGVAADRGAAGFVPVLAGREEAAELPIGAAHFAVQPADGEPGVAALAVEFDRAVEAADLAPG